MDGVEPPRPDAGRRAVVVGCGPAGSLTAIYLARAGWQVRVYEKGAPCGSGDARGAGSRRAYDIMLGPKALDAIAGAGAQLGPETAVEVTGLVFHRGGDRGFREWHFKGIPAVSVRRDFLGAALMKHGARVHADRIKYNFGHRLAGIDFEGRIATFDREGDGLGVVEVEYELLVGADGVWSAVRGEMQRAGFATVRQERNEGCNRVVEVAGLPLARRGWEHRLHVWVRHAPRVFMLAAPSPEGRYRLIIGTTHADWWDGLAPGAPRTVATVEARLVELFPDAFEGREVPEGLARCLVEQGSNHRGVETNCSAFHAGDSVVLVGDAAHSMWVQAGQGCNCALESCGVLARVIGEHGGDLGRALPAFTALRKPDTDAAAAISRWRRFTSGYWLRVAALWALRLALPGLVEEPAEVFLKKGVLAYREVAKLHGRQSAQLWAVTLAGAGLVGGLLVCGWRRARS